MRDLPLFNYAESQRLADVGIAVAAENNASNVIKAREIAFEIAREQGSVDMDRVMRRWVALGGRINDFGNSAGAIFKDRRFVFRNETKRSERLSAKSRLLRIWRLKI